MDFAFPVLAPAASVSGDPAGGVPKQQQQQQQQRLPLTARSTVTHVAVALPADDAATSTTKAAPSRVEKSQSQVDYLRLTADSTAPEQLREVAPAELALHARAGDAWVCIKGKVYDMTRYLQFHPGGARILLKAAGTDATALFVKHHAWVDADYLLSRSAVGWLQRSEQPAIAE